jgi:hypothetical protein
MQSAECRIKIMRFALCIMHSELGRFRSGVEASEAAGLFAFD